MSPANETFKRYAPFIQEYIYRKNWTDLRAVQTEACHAILDTTGHVIIASGTASGKTEAAFFPMLTLLDQKPAKSVGILYIGPLKALINDQFSRLSEMLKEVQIPVWPWHGDIPQNQKQKALLDPEGVVQITPESLKALLMRHPQDAAGLFADLRFIVIDEIHAFMGTDRGLQLISLMSRLDRMIGHVPRRIGLSATLNEYDSALRYLSQGSTQGGTVVGARGEKRAISIGVESFTLPKGTKNEPEGQAVYNQYNKFIYDHCHDKKAILFTNSRGAAEQVIADMKQIAVQSNQRDIFYVHHGSVSAELRKQTEQALRDREGPTVTSATLTLELGIDIGDLDLTIQLGAPYSSASFVQRLGRSGRRTGRSKMMFVDLYEVEETGDTLGHRLNQLPWPLLRSIAIIQLYREAHWVEPFMVKEKPFSLLVHQTLSTLYEKGSLLPKHLAQNVLTLPPFHGLVTPEEYQILLRYLMEKNVLIRLDNGELLLGQQGERLTNFYTFYAVFKDQMGYRVKSGQKDIGTVERCPAPGEVFSLGGASWKVEVVDRDKKIVFVTPFGKGAAPSWRGSDSHIHGQIIQRIRQILLEDDTYGYLLPGAKSVLAKARAAARANGFIQTSVIPEDDNKFLLIPWCGTKELDAIKRLLTFGLNQELGVLSVTGNKYYLEVTSRLSPAQFIEKTKSLTLDIEDPNIVLAPDESPMIDKNDYLVPMPLLRKAFLKNETDVPEALRILASLS